MNDEVISHYKNMHKEGGVDNPKAAVRVGAHRRWFWFKI